MRHLFLTPLEMEDHLPNDLIVSNHNNVFFPELFQTLATFVYCEFGLPDSKLKSISPSLTFGLYKHAFHIDS